jgi:hypothetical protein
MLRPSRFFLLLILLFGMIPVCRAQSHPQHVRDYIYGPDGRVILTAEPSQYPPGAPPYLSASPGECAIDGIALNWGTATDVGPGIGSYNLYQNGSWEGSFGVSTTSYTDYNVTGGQNYTYSVTAVDRAGNASDAAYASASVPLCMNMLFPQSPLTPAWKHGIFARAQLNDDLSRNSASRWRLNTMYRNSSALSFSLFPNSNKGRFQVALLNPMSLADPRRRFQVRYEQPVRLRLIPLPKKNSTIWDSEGGGR